MKKTIQSRDKMGESGSEVFVKEIYKNTKRKKCNYNHEEQPLGICLSGGMINEYCNNCYYYREVKGYHEEH